MAKRNKTLQSLVKSMRAEQEAIDKLTRDPSAFVSFYQKRESIQAAFVGAVHAGPYMCEKKTPDDGDATESGNQEVLPESNNRDEDARLEDEDDEAFEDPGGGEEDFMERFRREIAEAGDDSEDELGPGELIVNDVTIGVHDWLGKERDTLIRSLHGAAEFAPPPHLAAPLWMHQLSACAKLRVACEGPLRGCIVTDEMGSGKTRTAITYMIESKDRIPGAFSLVVAPRSVLHQWGAEIQNLFEAGHRPRWRILSEKMSILELLAGDYDIVLCSYHQLLHQHRELDGFKTHMEECSKKGKTKARSEALVAGLRTRRPLVSVFAEVLTDLNLPIKLLILDEVHNVKLFDGKIRKALKELPYHSLVGLTGTPFPNVWPDVFGIIDLMPTEPLRTLKSYYRIFGERVNDRHNAGPTQTAFDRLSKYLMSFSFGRPASILGLKKIHRETRSFWESKGIVDYVLAQMERFWKACGRLQGDAESSRVMVYPTLAQLATAHPKLLSKHESVPEEGLGAEHSHVAFQQAVRHARAVGHPRTGWASVAEEDLTSQTTMEYFTAYFAWQQERSRAASQRARPSADSDDDDYDDDYCDTVLQERVSSSEEKKWAAELKKMTVEELSSMRLAHAVSVLEEVWTNFPGERVIVFSRFVLCLDLLEELIFKKYGERSVRFDGSLDSVERDAALRRFAHGSAKEPLLMSQGAGGTGLNVQVANHVVFLEPWWNATQVEQAEARCHRPGQTREVYTYTITGVNSAVDHHIRATAARKRETTRRFMQALRFADGEQPSIPTVIPQVGGIPQEYDARGMIVPPAAAQSTPEGPQRKKSKRAARPKRGSK